ANRNREEIEPLIGFFVNQLVMRTDLSGGPTFRELLQRVREVCLGAYAHQDLPFEKLVEALQPERDPSRSPLFQVKLVLQTAPTGDPDRISELSLSPVGKNLDVARFDLTWALIELEHAVVGTMEYNTDLFDTATVRQMTDHLQNLLEGILEHVDLPISRLPMLSEIEREQLLIGWNNTAADYPRSVCVHHLFERQAELTPEGLAVVFGNQQLTYADLNKRANQLSHHLRSLGIGPEVLVGICVERSVEMVVGLLAILKAGGAYVPLDPEYPAERLSYMLEDAGIAVLLSENQLLDRLPTHWALIFSLDEDWPAVAAYPEDNLLDTEVLPDNLAYVIYTSGSTGRPNGVAITHHGLANLVHWHQEAFAISAADRAPQIAGTSFDASAWEIWPHLTAGASLHLPPESVRVAAPELRDWLLAEEITVGFVPTPLAEQLLGLSWPAESRLRLLLTGGGPLGQYPERRHPFELVNNYGPTEGTVVSTSVTIGCAVAGERRAPAIGKPIANVKVYLLDEEMEPVPVGVAGELYVGGAGLARAYHNRASLTASRFVPDRFGGIAGARLYRTGDLGRWRADGELEFLGRVDEQVKVRGYRIELGEIEAVLLRHEGVNAAVVVAREEAGGEKRLVGYVVLAVNADEQTAVSVAGLREYLAERLPSYMVPALVLLEELPLTPNGKVDRRLLLGSLDVAGSPRTFVAPRTFAELQLVRMWEDILGLEQVGVHDNFFELGGHSLLAARLMSRIRRETGKDLPLALLFKAQTVEQLAGHLRDQSSVHTGPLVKLQDGTGRPFFCVHPVGGNVLCYAELARALGADQTFYGIQSPAPEDLNESPRSIQQMARSYLEAILTVQSQGPYLLGGWSMGGLIAFEMARALERKGEVVSLLALVDPTPPRSNGQVLEDDELSLLMSFAQDLGLEVSHETWPRKRFEQLQPGE
ncbi:MAG TPA: amino acid adenylation domain-containing protein, partial [Pyrinomonadaceae bacterium]|nr:amino acid adenylation domain-containing protein [Pyrinomonadaceae bacterium]